VICYHVSVVFPCDDVDSCSLAIDALHFGKATVHHGFVIDVDEDIRITGLVCIIERFDRLCKFFCGRRSLKLLFGRLDLVIAIIIDIAIASVFVQIVRRQLVDVLVRVLHVKVCVVIILFLVVLICFRDYSSSIVMIVIIEVRLKFRFWTLLPKVPL